MVLTFLDLLTEAMREVGAVAANEPLEAHEVQVGLKRFNMMLGLWGATPLMIRANVTEHFTLVTGTASYTIGVGATFNTIKPYTIVDAYVRDSYSQDYPLEIISQDEYDALDDKILTSARPEKLFYDPGLAQQTVQTGTIYINPPPDAGSVYELYLVSVKMLTEIAAAATSITFEPVYYEPLMYNLAKRLWGIYHDSDVPVKRSIMEFARQGKKVLETLNSKNVISRTDLPSVRGGGSYNIYKDDYNY